MYTFKIGQEVTLRVPVYAEELYSHELAPKCGKIYTISSIEPCALMGLDKIYMVQFKEFGEIEFPADHFTMLN